MLVDSTGFAAAVASASAGDVLRLTPGDYGAMPSIPNGITLVSDEPADPASFSQAHLSDLTDVTFESLLFDYVYQVGDNDTANHFSCNDCTNLTIRRSRFDGDADAAGKYIGRGLRITGALGLQLHCNEFSKFWTGASVGHGGNGATSHDVHVFANDVHSIRSDGFKFSDNVNLLVEGNYLHDFGGTSGAGDHRDMIQFGGDIDGLEVRDNFFDMNEGFYSQTLWSDAMKPMRNVLVRDNTLLNAHTHGISMHNMVDVQILDNIIAPVPREETGGVAIPKINLSAGGTVEVIGNTVPGIIGQAPHWTVQDNTLVELDHDEVRADAVVDPRWAHFFGG